MRVRPRFATNHQTTRLDVEQWTSDGVIGRLVLGSEEFVEELIAKGNKSRKSQPEMVKALKSRPSFAKVIEVIEEIKGEAWAGFCERRGDWGRELPLYLGREVAALTLGELQAEVKAGTAMAVSSALRRFDQRLCEQKPLRKLLARAIKTLRDR